MEKKSKFKVGDRVRTIPEIPNGPRETGVVVGFYACFVGVRFDREDICLGNLGSLCDKFHGFWCKEESLELLNQSIHIYVNGITTTAVLKENGKTAKTAVAICSKSDTFDFATGAKRAFYRLMGEEATVEPEKPKPLNCKFVVTQSAEYGMKVGRIYTVEEGKFKDDSGYLLPIGEVLTDYDILVAYLNRTSAVHYGLTPVNILRIEE